MLLASLYLIANERKFGSQVGGRGKGGREQHVGHVGCRRGGQLLLNWDAKVEMLIIWGEQKHVQMELLRCYDRSMETYYSITSL